MTVILKRITTLYIPVEDRIRLTGADESGTTLTLWLTHRLLNRLITHLCEGLEKQTISDVLGSGGGGPSSIPSVQAHMVQTFAQQKAAAALPKTSPVVPVQHSSAWVVESVVLKPGKRNVRLTFKGLDAANSAVLTLSSIELRQWLGIVFKQSQKAAWVTHGWPAWIEEASNSPLTHQPHALH